MCPHTTTIYVSSYYIYVLIPLCVLILLYLCLHTTVYVSSSYFMCPHTTISVSSYYCICVLKLPCVLILQMCPHTNIYVSSYYYLCPHTNISVSSYYYICVLILLYVSSYHCICVLILLNMCPHTTTSVQAAIHELLRLRSSVPLSPAAVANSSLLSHDATRGSREFATAAPPPADAAPAAAGDAGTYADVC